MNTLQQIIAHNDTIAQGIKDIVYIGSNQVQFTSLCFCNFDINITVHNDGSITEICDGTIIEHAHFEAYKAAFAV